MQHPNDFTFKMMHNGHQIAEIECRFDVDPTGAHPVEVFAYELGYRWTRLVPLSEPLHTEVLDYLDANCQERVIEALAEAAHGAMQYSREVAAEFRGA